MRKFNVSDIDWNLEGIENDDFDNLPNELCLEIEDSYLSDCEDKNIINDAIIEMISDRYGVCCNSCVIEEV
jgi:hypothetical protein